MPRPAAKPADLTLSGAERAETTAVVALAQWVAAGQHDGRIPPPGWWWWRWRHQENERRAARRLAPLPPRCWEMRDDGAA